MTFHLDETDEPEMTPDEITKYLIGIFRDYERVVSAEKLIAEITALLMNE